MRLRTVCLLAAFAVNAHADFLDLSTRVPQFFNTSSLTRAADKVKEADALRNAGKLDEAIAASAEAVAFGPDLPMAQAIHGQVLHRMGKHDLAVKHLKRAVELQKDFVGAWMELALTNLDRNNAAGALEAADQLVKLTPNTAAAHGVRGAAMLMKKDADAAMEEFTTAIRIDKTYAYAFEGRASAYEMQSETKSALVDLDRAHAITREPRLLLRRAGLKIKRNDRDGAMEDYALALKADLDPQTAARVHLARAEIFTEWKQKDRAAEERSAAALALANQADPKNQSGMSAAAAAPALGLPPELVRALQLFQQSAASNQKGKTDEALKQLDEAIKLAPKFAEAYGNRGLILFNRAKYKEAIADFNHAIEYGVKVPGIRVQRGLAHAMLGEFPKAVADFDVAIKADAKQAMWFVWRSNCLRRQSKFEDARKDCDAALALDSKLAPACEERARVLALLGKLQDALADADRLLELQPKVAAFYVLRGAIHNQMGNLQAALADLDQAVTLDGNFSLAYQERSVVYQKMNRPDLATRDLLKVSELTKPQAPASQPAAPITPPR